MTNRLETLAAAAANGVRVLATSDTPKAAGTCAGRFILHVVGGHHPYATHWENTELGGKSYGHYFDNLADAVADFDARVERG